MGICNLAKRAAIRSSHLTRLAPLLGLVIAVLAINTASAASVPKGYLSNGSPDSDVTALLGRFGELIARERAYGETVYELVKNTRGESPFKMDDSMLDAVLGADFYARYDEVLPMLEALGQKSRRDEIALRFNHDAQKNLIAGERVAGINEAAVNNVIAHYKIAIEKLDTNARQLLLAESLLLRRSADELDMAFNDSGVVIDYVSYVRASHLLSAPRQVKGFVQARCNLESGVMKQSRSIRNSVEDKFFFDGNMKFQTSVQEIYDAAELLEAQALLLSENGSHCK